MVLAYPKGSDLYSRPYDKQIYNYKHREGTKGSVDFIVILELNAEKGRYKDIPLKRLLKMTGELTAAFEADDEEQKNIRLAKELKE